MDDDQMTVTLDEVTQLITDCENRSKRLNAWENDFIDTLRGRIDRKISPTIRQVDTLNKIWEKATEKG